MNRGSLNFDTDTVRFRMASMRPRFMNRGSGEGERQVPASGYPLQ